LPEAISVEFEGLVLTYTRGAYLSACFGTGAALTAHTVDGSVVFVEVIGQGSGYAVLGRAQQQPSLLFSASSTTPALVSVITEQQQDECGRPYYAVTGVVIEDGGGGYTLGQQCQFLPGPGDTQEQAAQATIVVNVEPPSAWTFIPVNGQGQGASISPTLNPTGTPEAATWGISSTAISGGSNYTVGEQVIVRAADGETLSDAILEMTEIDPQFYRGEPDFDLFPSNSAGGSGVVLSFLTYEFWFGFPPRWAIYEASVQAGGSGYSVGDIITPGTTSGVVESPAEIYVAEVDENGAVLSVFVGVEGAAYSTTSGTAYGAALAATVLQSGEFYGTDDGKIIAVSITNGGRYYREDPSLPPLVAEATVSISGGPGIIDGTAVPVIDAEVGSATFGKVVQVNVTSGGSGYGTTADGFSISPCDLDRLNGRAYLIRKSPTIPCEYSACLDGFLVTVRYNGYNNSPTVTVNRVLWPHTQTRCGLLLKALSSDAPFPCDPLEFTAVHPYSGSATVAAAEASDVIDCDKIRNANSVTLSIEASDVLTNSLHTVPGSWYQRGGSYAPLSKYAGEFELTRVAPGPGLIAKFIYFYEEQPEFCGEQPYIILGVGTFELHYEIGRQIAYVTSKRVAVAEPPPPALEEEDFVCEKVPFGSGQLPQTSTFHGFFDLFRLSDCPCSPLSLPSTLGFAPAPSVSSDGFYVEQPTGSGDPTIRLRITGTS
jgi:hypothetical protein